MGAFGLIIFGKQQHLAGNAPDTTPTTFDINPEALRVDIAIFDNIALLSFSDNGTNFTSEREFPAGTISSLDIRVRKFTIRNKTALSIARFDVTAYYDPVLIQGRPYVRNP